MADEVRYMCMARPIKPRLPAQPKEIAYDPLSTDEVYGRYDWMRM